MMLRILVVMAGLAAPAWTQTPAVEHVRAADVLELRGTVYHVQGVDLDEKHIWVTSVDKDARKGYLHQFDRKTGLFERQVELTDGPRFHAGGFSVRGDSIWVPVAEYRPNSSAVLVELDRKTLAVKRRIPVADHLGCVAVAKGELVAGNWGSRKLYVLSMDGKQRRVIDVQSQNQYQDIKYAGGLLVGGGTLSKTTGAVDWYTWPAMKLVKSWPAGTTDRGKLYTEEGMALHGRDLYLLPEDGPTRMFHFVLEAAPPS